MPIYWHTNMSKLAKLSSIYLKTAQDACKGGVLPIGGSCMPASRQVAQQIATEFKILPLFKSLFFKNAAQKVVDAILDGDGLDQNHLAEAAALLATPEYSMVDKTKWQQMLDHYMGSAV